MAQVSRGMVAACVLSVLAACGGGGGGGDGSAPNGGGGSGATGLVPSAPVPGATLYADAGSLRPMVEGGTWTYRGKSTAFVGAAAVSYETTTIQSGVSTIGATESTSNSGNTGVGSQTLSIANGVVATPQTVDFAGKGNSQVLNFVELRSPVRQGDQYTLLDKHYADTAIDADGDGKADSLDVAIYARVAGAESVALPNLPLLQGVRVDTFVLTRVTYSSNGKTSPLVQASLQTWYAAGIGIVRQTASIPAGSGIATTDEQLAAWDGIATGLGAMPPVNAVIPTSSGVFPSQALRGSSLRGPAISFGDHALVFTETFDIFPSATLASTVDLRGRVTSTTLLSGLSVGAGTVVALKNGVIHLEPMAAGANKDFGFTRIDSNGRLVGSVRGSTLGLGGAHVSSYVTELAAAADDSTLWVLWARNYYDPGNGAVPSAELILQPYSFDGVALAPEIVVDSSSSKLPRLAVADGQVLMYWSRVGASETAMFGAASLAGLGPIRALASGLSTSAIVTPLRLGAYGALMWPLPPSSFFSVGTSGGVLLDSSLTPVRVGSSFLDEQIAALPMYNGQYLDPEALGSRIFVTTTATAALWPGETITQMVDTVSWFDVSGSPLANAQVKSVRFASTNAARQAVFADRVLVFGIDSGTGLTTTVVWLNQSALK